VVRLRRTHPSAATRAGSRTAGAELKAGTGAARTAPAMRSG
jgi:hypothetical protein